MEKLTPMLRQYRQLKARFPDAILLFHLGDFYEMFEEDARLVSRQLDLVLTSRRFSKSVRLPMCGIPYRRLTTYVAKLLALGHKVTIAEQLEEPRHPSPPSTRPASTRPPPANGSWNTWERPRWNPTAAKTSLWRRPPPGLPSVTSRRVRSPIWPTYGTWRPATPRPPSAWTRSPAATWN